MLPNPRDLSSISGVLWQEERTDFHELSSHTACTSYTIIIKNRKKNRTTAAEAERSGLSWNLVTLGRGARGGPSPPCGLSSSASLWNSHLMTVNLMKSAASRILLMELISRYPGALNTTPGGMPSTTTQPGLKVIFL